MSVSIKIRTVQAAIQAIKELGPRALGEGLCENTLKALEEMSTTTEQYNSQEKKFVQTHGPTKIKKDKSVPFQRTMRHAKSIKQLGKSGVVLIQATTAAINHFSALKAAEKSLASAQQALVSMSVFMEKMELMTDVHGQSVCNIAQTAVDDANRVVDRLRRAMDKLRSNIDTAVSCCFINAAEMRSVYGYLVHDMTNFKSSVASSIDEKLRTKRRKEAVSNRHDARTAANNARRGIVDIDNGVDDDNVDDSVTDDDADDVADDDTDDDDNTNALV
jgi:hypothetical protein